MANKKKTTTKKAKKITSSELIGLIKDIDVDDAKLAKYFKVDENQPDGFVPKIVLDRSLIHDDGLESAKLLNVANGLARWRRNRRYRKRIKNWKS